MNRFSKIRGQEAEEAKKEPTYYFEPMPPGWNPDPWNKGQFLVNDEPFMEYLEEKYREGFELVCVLSTMKKIVFKKRFDEEALFARIKDFLSGEGVRVQQEITVNTGALNADAISVDLDNALRNRNSEMTEEERRGMDEMARARPEDFVPPEQREESGW